ncbi:ribosomal protein S4 [Thermodesulfatator indicus DSM 15286]|uniref:Small ribosomal subunit protein uS4 n=1 Tax=Thermodesulfatator indicus (strain DSM 15286 / JCM 11887 / CIR29812) TaxID=667014 RepID=F8A994_THEID|nr:30S ribosomal protein S4 [Thermodesulfatator indicus]AEH45351.1 ribosomal protein S4 [Thermodesulfatator indicus DSM 15286]
MAKYTGPRCRLCRREGMKLFLKGDRCYTDKCAFERRSYPPGQHGQAQIRAKRSDYGIRLREKQKVKRIYGVSEKQFAKYFDRADRMKGQTGHNLLQLLERRLDNVVYRLGFASSRMQARQMVAHGLFKVNGRNVDIPSYLVKPGEVIELKEKYRQNARIQENLEAAVRRGIPQWLELDADNFKGTVKALPTREDITMPIQEQLIVEFYSR